MDNSGISTFEYVRKSHVEDVEEWKDIPDYEGYYQCSSFGKIKSVERLIEQNGMIKRLREKILKSGKDKDGYNIIWLHKSSIRTTFRICRIVAILFVPNPENLLEVNHENGIKDCDKYWNLGWTDRSGNVQHAYDTGLKSASKGEFKLQSKLKDFEVVDIRRLFAEGVNREVIMKRFDIGKTQLYRIANNENWKHLNLSDEGKTATEGTLNNT